MSKSDEKSIDITFRSGAHLRCSIREQSLSDLLANWRAVLSGDRPAKPLQSYDVSVIAGIVPVQLLLDISAIESVQIHDISVLQSSGDEEE